jgi:hypothetical protein
VGKETCHVGCAGGVADGHYLVTTSSKQVDILVDPRDRRRDIFGASGPRICGSRPVGHFHANHSVAHCKAHRLILERARDIGRSIVAGKAFSSHEQKHRARRHFLDIAGCDIKDVNVGLAISQIAGKRDARA